MTTERTDVVRARAELATTIDAIEYKLDVPKRVSERVRRLRADNPVALYAMAAGVAAGIGGVVWFIVHAARK